MRSTKTLVAIVTAALVATACGGGGGADSGGDDTVSIGATAEPSTLDLTTTSVAAIPQVLLYNVYETLVKVDQDGEVAPSLAESYNRSKDRKTYTFTLREGVKFSNGKALTPEDVVYSFDRVRAKDSKHPFKAQMKPVRDVRAKGDDQVVVTLKHPSNSWLYNMTSATGIIFDENEVDKLATDPVGTGPYEFQSWSRGTSISLAANPDYWGKKPFVQKVVFKYYDDPNAMNNAMLSDDLDVISNVQAPQTLKQFDDRSRFSVTEGTTNGEVVLGMNNASSALKDERVRQAIRYAIDRKALMKTVWSGHGKQIGSMVPPTDPWYEDLSGEFSYDPQKAKQLLKEAGKENLKLEMKLPTLPYATASGQFVASQLKKVGIDCKVSELEFPARWIDVVFTQSDYDLSIVSHVEPRDIAQYGNPDYYWHYDDPQVRQWLTKADRGTLEEQNTYMRKVAQRISAKAASDWLFLLPNLVVAQKGVTGYPQNAVTLSFELANLKTS